ncbi:MAG: DNA methyltransferase [Chitinophagaceae bacterium]|nr:DNA methyltransferase [Chitinophagaceae bacterium]
MEWTAKQDGVEKIPEWQQKSLFQFWLLPKNKELNQRAKELRKQGILSEVLFWKNFKNKEKLKGYDIDRQIIIGNFIVDFFIAELGLVIEIDGASHDDKQEYDQERQEFLEDLGLKVIRYTDKEVKQNIEGIYQDFLKNIENREKELSTYPPRQSTIDTPQRGEFSTHYPFKRGIDGTIKENLIIKGNNLLALHSLKSEFAGKVKLIYIDPPYNTGNDGFQYNDNFNHSTWLTFMKNRLDVAKELLRDDGVIFVQCDDNEQAYLKVLMDEIQDIQFINCITVKMNESKGLKNAHIEKRLPKSKEYILVYSKNKFIFNPQKIEKNQDELKGYVKYYNKQILNINEDMSLWKIGDFSESIDERLLNADKLIYLVEPDNDIKLYLKKNSFGRIVNSKGNANYYYNNGKDILKVLFLSQNLNRFIGDLWTDISTININKEGGIPVLSNGQKPEKIIQRIIDLATNTSDIVLDYHLGSGTTCAVAHKMNRQYIGIEQMDYIETIAVERIKNATQGEQGGISKAVGWQGGGEFIYCELAKWNEKAKEEIQNAKDLPALVKLFDTLYEKYFLNYNVKIKDFKEKIVKEEGFKKLALAQQKKMFLTMLDLNQMYVQESEMADERYGISTEDQKLTKAFYSKK